ncbi:protein mono-ADP-ribosyltransferase PARP14 isoform X2 [Alosa pseudoharengus]|uniref:protein mono-ADP-ribosyltransferase PARP14 isoform X2 n=1 Tax=Alosa pseudoharengus TaxID=34774 RepID=UPI003F8A877B
MEEKTLILEGLPDDLNNIRPKLELYFKNKRRSGGEITDLRKHPTDDKKAMLVYLDGEGAKKVLDKTVHKLAIKSFGEVELTVTLPDNDSSKLAKTKPPVAPRPQMNKPIPSKKPIPPSRNKGVTEEAKDEIINESAGSKADESSQKVDLLLVSSKNPLHEDVLSMYFEKFYPRSEVNKHGDNHWILKLKTQSDVQKVLNHRGHKFGICVEVYHDNTPQPGCQEVSKEEISEANKLIVTKKSSMDNGLIDMYLEQFSENFEIHNYGKEQCIVKFANQSDAQKFLAREKHDLDISVEVYNEQAMQKRQDPRRFLLSGFGDSCKLNVVSLYIGSCSQGKEHTWEILDDEKILVTFKSDIDIQSFLKRCSTKRCQNMEITATCVQRADSVLVQGDMSTVSDDTLMLYFSNKKRSRGGEVKSLKWLDSRTSVVITFEDCHVVSQVVEKKHHICDRDLSVSVFHSNLQQPLTGTAPSSFVQPSDVTIPIHEALYDYLTRNEVCKKEITSELAKVHSNVAFGKTTEPCLILSFDAVPESLLALRLGSSWERKAKKTTQDILDKYSVDELAVGPDVWARTEGESIKLSSLNATVRYKKDAAKVVVVGMQGDVRSCMEGIRQTVATASQELEKERNTVERQIQVGSREELDFIWDRVHTQIKDMEFTKDDTSLTFVLKGLRDRVTEAEKILKDKQSNVVNQPLALSSALVDFIKLAGPNKLERDLAQNNIFISLSNQEESVQIIAEKGDIKSAEDKLGEILQEEEILLSSDPEKVILGEEWKLFHEGLLDEVKASNNVLHLKVLEGKIEVCGFASLVADVSRKLKGYLENKKPTSEEVPLKSVKEVQFVDSCMNLSEAPELKSLHVTILANKTEASPCLKITAPSSSIKDAVTLVKNKLTPIVNDTFLYSKAGQSKVLEKNEQSLQAKAKEMGCKLFFTVQKPPDVKATATAPQPTARAVGTAPTPLSPIQLPSSGTDLKVTVSGVPVFLRKGDITKEAVDVIVNSTNSSLNLDTGVSAAILKAAGQSVEDECKALGTQKNDAVVLTSGGSLSCKHIAHTVGPTSAADITSSIEKALDLCEGKTASSLSVPAIGTGRGGIKTQDSLGAILKGLENHLSRTTSSSIKAMNLVIFEQKVFDESSDYLKKRNTKHSSTIKYNPHGTLPADEVKIGGVRIQVKKGDLTQETVKGIVNTTNADMSLKGGVSGAIFRAAGTSVEQECQNHGSLKGNTAAVTSAGNLQCDFIIHMLGPHSAADATARVQNVLERCEEKGITTVSFPAVGTGGGGLKGQEAIMAMLQGVEDHLSKCSPTVLKLVYIVIDRDEILQEFIKGLKQWTAKKQDDEDDDDDDEDIKIEGAEDSDVEEVSEFSGSSASEEEEDILDGKNTETMIGQIKVKVFCGDITKETTQAIVSSTNTSLDLNSGVSGAILKAAGQTVVDECKAKGTQPSDGVVLTQAGNLATKHIVHMVGQTKEKEITSSMYKVLQLCEQNSIQSVSFPALGTGAGNLGAAQVARAMIEAVSNFAVDRPKCLKAVHVVVFQTKMLPDFVEALKKFKKVTPITISGILRQTFGALEKLRSSMSSPAKPPVSSSAAITNVSFPVMAVEAYSTSHNDLALVRKVLDDLLSEECDREEVVSKHLPQLSESDKQALAALSQGQQVEISTEASDKLSVSGKRDDVLATVVKIKDLLLGAQERETRESEEKRVKETLRWEVAEAGAWKAFGSSVSYTIELAFHRKEKKVTFKDQGETYTVDLKEKTCTDSKGRTRCVKRTLLGDSDTAVIHHPATWTPMTGKIHEIVPVSNTSEEYKKIEKGFLKSSINVAQGFVQKYQVVKIERVQSRDQWQRYAVLKQTIDKRLPKQKNQRHLYHGTTKEIAQKINMYGFNRSFCGRNATVHGEGTYFAKEAWYSSHDTYSNPDDQGLKYMYLASVLTGSPCKSKGGMKEPDPLDTSNPGAGLHDCAVDNLQNPFIFVVFCDAGAYPDYLITFKNA